MAIAQMIRIAIAQMIRIAIAQMIRIAILITNPNHLVMIIITASHPPHSHPHHDQM
jgi:hypothetical protein